jgi:hypothetical protein
MHGIVKTNLRTKKWVIKTQVVDQQNKQNIKNKSSKTIKREIQKEKILKFKC